jgi:predicted RNase H-like nuclease
MGPLTARAAYLRQALLGTYQLHHNLIEVYPKATLTLLFPDPAPPSLPSAIRYRDAHGRAVSLTGKPLQPGSQVAHTYKRGHGPNVRERVLLALPELGFAPGQWREFVVKNDHIFDALICAYTAYLWARDGWQLPVEPVFRDDGFIWTPPRRSSSL